MSKGPNTLTRHDAAASAFPLERPVVVAVDGSLGSQEALRWAVEDARMRDLPVRVVVVADPPVTTYYPYAPPPARETFLHGASEAYRVSATFDDAMDYARSQLPSGRVTGGRYRGDAANVLITESRRAEMMVVGTRGRAAVTAAVAGSVSAAVAAHAACPVVVVRPMPRVDDDTGGVMVGVDGSSGSSRVLEFAFTEAANRKVPLLVVHSAPLAVAETALRNVPLGGLLPGVEDDLDRWRGYFPDVELRTHLLAGDPVVKLTEQSAAAHLVVVGSRGRGPISGLLLGSVSQAMLHHAHCPVAIIR